MPHFEIALVEWPEGLDAGGPRLLGRLSDPSVVEQIRSKIASARRRDLARLERPARPVPAPLSDESLDDAA